MVHFLILALSFVYIPLVILITVLIHFLLIEIIINHKEKKYQCNRKSYNANEKFKIANEKKLNSTMSQSKLT